MVQCLTNIQTQIHHGQYSNNALVKLGITSRAIHVRYPIVSKGRNLVM